MMALMIKECGYTCDDTNKDSILPAVKLDYGKISVVMISECPPTNRGDYFYAGEKGSFFKTTQAAFKDAGIEIHTYDDLSRLGVYLTTAIKCGKKGYAVSKKTIEACSTILNEELRCFPNLKVIMCMGDVAIKAVNDLYHKQYRVKPIKSGSTYKIRKTEHVFNGIRLFPSYTQTGDSFNIEKSKRRMIAEDIRNAFDYLKREKTKQ
jgi:uracil-DNA glycosylase